MVWALRGLWPLLWPGLLSVISCVRVQLSQEGVKRIKQLEAQPAPVGQNRESPTGPGQAAWLITEQRPPRSSRTPGPQPDKEPWGRKRTNTHTVHPACTPTLPPRQLPAPTRFPVKDLLIPRCSQAILPDPCLGFSLSIPFRAPNGLPKTLRVVGAGGGLANLSLKPPETRPPAVPGSRGGVLGRATPHLWPAFQQASSMG